MNIKSLSKSQIIWILQIVYLAITIIFLILGIADQAVMGISNNGGRGILSAQSPFGPLSVFSFISLLMFLLIPLYIIVKLIRAKQGAHDDEQVAKKD